MAKKAPWESVLKIPCSILNTFIPAFRILGDLTNLFTRPVPFQRRRAIGNDNPCR